MSQEDTPATGEKPDAPKSDADKSAPESTDQPKTFDADYVKTLRSESAARRAENKQLQERLEELETRDQSEAQKAQTKAAKAEQAKAEAEAKLLRFEVAAEKQVPADALDLLTGNSREELEARADKLLELVKRRNDNDTPDFDGGTREPAPDPKTPEEQHNETILALLGMKPS